MNACVIQHQHGGPYKLRQESLDTFNNVFRRQTFGGRKTPQCAVTAPKEAEHGQPQTMCLRHQTHGFLSFDCFLLPQVRHARLQAEAAGVRVQHVALVPVF